VELPTGDVEMPQTSVELMTSSRDAAHCVNAVMSREIPEYTDGVEEACIRRYAALALTHESYRVFVGKVDQNPALFLGGMLAEQIYNTQKRCVLLMLVTPKPNLYARHFLPLLSECFDALEAWAEKSNAPHIVAGHDSGIENSEALGKLLVRRGYTTMGELFHKRMTT